MIVMIVELRVCASAEVSSSEHHHDRPPQHMAHTHPYAHPQQTPQQVAELPQEVRDHVGTCLLRLTLRELYEWRFMQTDPNWGNFLYDQGSGVLNLIDFGAAKQYPRRWVGVYLVFHCLFGGGGV